VIFLTVGTHTQPFDRALQLLAEAEVDEPVVVQHGATPPRPDLLEAEWHEFLEADVMAARMRDARVVVAHAGVGCTLMSLRAGKKPILIPRRFARSEHIDDHQIQLAQRFGDRGLVFVHRDGELLAPLIARAGAEPPYVLGESAEAFGRAVVAAALGPAPTRRLRWLRRSHPGVR
jgi:UDP-N-acetylglucosamine transferase subunit ALG13